MAADRAQHMEQVVRPALNAGQHVVSDRSIYSTLAYQGYGRGLDIDELRRISTWALNGTLPDIVIFMSVPTDILNERLAKRNLDRFEREGADFFARIHDGFRALMAADPQRWIVIDGTMPKDDVEEAIRVEVMSRIEGA
jgi:dTMP kinase